MVDTASILANVVMALLMVAMFVAYVFNVVHGTAELKVMNVLGYTALGVCGLAILLDRERDLPRSAGMFAIGMGTYRALTAISYLKFHSYSNVVFLVMLALGLNMALSGRSYLKGRSRSRVTMLASTLLMLLVNVLFLIYMYYSLGGIEPIMEEYPQYVVLVAMYAVFIMMLDSEKLRNLDWLEVHSRSMAEICRTYQLDPGAEIEREDARMLAEGFRSFGVWPVMDDGGPVEEEVVVRFKNRGGLTYVVFQRWNGSVYATMADHGSGTILQASRFLVDSMDFDEGMFSIMASDGTLINVVVVEEFAWC